MHEIIQVQIGQCGNHIGVKFWEIIAEEHGIRFDGTHSGDSETQYRDAFFRVSKEGRYTPRTVLVDSEPGIKDFCQNMTHGNFFPPDNFVCGQSSASNNWAKGCYSEGADLLDNVLEVLRKEAEACDCLQGFQMTHSLGGGTGSGMGMLLVNKIRQEYPTRIISSYSVIPSPKLSDVVLEPYNAMLSMPDLIENLDMVVCLDNEALYGIYKEALRISAPNYGDINHLVSLAMSGVTTCLRFPGRLSGNLHKLALNMLPFPKLHFLMASIAPLTSRGITSNEPVEIVDLISKLFSARNMTTACDPAHGVYLTAAAMYRGQLSAREVENEITKLQDRNSSYFVNWIPDKMRTDFCAVAPPGMNISATCLANNTAVQEIFGRLRAQFDAMFRRRAFVHWYTNEGMDEMDFIGAKNKVDDLITLYQQHEEIPAENTFEMWDEE